MAQLPPKIPMSMSHWPMNTAFAAEQPQRQGWDDFPDFAAARRGSHRRSASDSVAFIEPFINDVDDQMMMMSCMFSATDDMSSAAASSAAPPDLSSPSTGPSSPSDNNNSMMMDMIIGGDGNNIINDIFSQHPKAEPGEAESSPGSAGDHHAPPQPLSPGSDSVFDPKRVKRILANRQSAQRSRVRKLQYISELERGVTSLQSEVSALSPRVAFLDHQRLILNVDNSALKQRIAALAQDKIFKDAHQEALKKEIERLRQVYHHQNLNKIIPNHNSQDHPNSDDAMPCTDRDPIPN